MICHFQQFLLYFRGFHQALQALSCVLIHPIPIAQVLKEMPPLGISKSRAIRLKMELAPEPKTVVPVNKVLFFQGCGT